MASSRPSQRSRYSPESVESLVNSLDRLRVTQPKAVNYNDHVLPGSTTTGSKGETAAEPATIRSWKMAEHLYRRKDCPFPTLARGLFVQTLKEEDGRARSRIAARGYDKFFNVGEVDWTEWSHLERNSVGPYHLTYKSNGCLILISALSPTELLVTSKHSLGTSIVPKEPGSQPESSKQAQEREKEREKAVPGTAAFGEAKAAVKVEEVKVEATQVDPPVSTGVGSEAPQDPSPGPSNTHKSKNQQKAESKKAEKEAKKAARAEGAEEMARLKAEQKKRREDEDGGDIVQHAEMGRRWVKETLRRAGKSEEELAQILWDKQYTAVTELCDDSFEEHVLPTPEHLTGLHLHGLNFNTPHFATLDPDEVEAFAREWGFIPTPSVRLDSVDEVRRYTDRVSQEGTWQGEAIEGFVVRCRVKEVAESSAGVPSRPDGMPPYPPRSPYFFKVKFEEPYLMYRQWREITRGLLPLLQPGCKGRTDRKAFPWTQLGAKLKRPESAVYADWCARTMVDEPELFDNYDKGVVRVRERFLAWTKAEGRETWESARGGQTQAPTKTKTLIIPVAVPGCGKTLLGLALSRLFGCAHTQSDDVTTKRTAAGFLANITTALKTNDVVYCDRNNHLPKHHSELSDLAASLSTPSTAIRTLALVWDIDSIPFNRALRLASERVLLRGEAHQSLRPDPADTLRHEAVIKGFINEFVPPEGGAFGRVVRLRMEASTEENLRVASEVIAETLGVPAPDEGAQAEALKDAAAYRPAVKKELQGRPTPPIRYYGLALEVDLVSMVEGAVERARAAGEDPGADMDGAEKFLRQLVANGRVTAKPHVTIVHEVNVAAERAAAEAKANANDLDTAHGPEPEVKQETSSSSVATATALWNACSSLTVPPRFAFDLVALLWDDRAMAFVVDRVQPMSGASGPASTSPPAPEDAQSQLDTSATEQTASGGDKDGSTAITSALASLPALHVTVGTASAEIPPFEARGLVERWRAGLPAESPRAGVQGGHESGQGGEVYCLTVDGLGGSGRVLGMY